MSLPRSPWSSGAQNTCPHLELPAVTTTAACPTHGHGRLPKGRTGDQHNQSPGERDKARGYFPRNTHDSTFHPETKSRRGLHLETPTGKPVPSGPSGSFQTPANHSTPRQGPAGACISTATLPTQTVSQAMQSLVGSPSWSAPRRVSTVSSSPDSRTSPSRALQSSHVHIHSSPGSRPPKTKRLKSLPLMDSDNDTA